MGAEKEVTKIVTAQMIGKVKRLVFVFVNFRAPGLLGHQLLVNT